MGYRETTLRKFRDFKAGSIHEAEVFEFWEKELRAPEWVLNTLKLGYMIPFKALPGQYEERNNKTVRENMKIVRGIMAEMIANNIVYVVKEKPHCVNPLGLVTKVQEDGSIRNRLVLDVSRHVNDCIEKPHVRLSHLVKAVEITEQGDYQLVFDLASAYYHIKIEETQQKYLGAAFQNSDGTVVYVQYAHLPFGISSAVHGITKIWKPITRYLSAQGIRNSIYIDDGRIVAESKEEVERQGIVTYNVITQAGWAIEEKKSDQITNASQEKKYLGFLLNSRKMDITATKGKLEKTKLAINETLRRERTPVKHLAGILGQINSLEPSHGMAARIATKSGYAAVAEHTEVFGWKGTVELTEGIVKELEFFLSRLEKGNGAPMKSKLRQIRLEMVIKNPIAKKMNLEFHEKAQEIFISDASEKKVYVYNLENAENTTLEANFTDEQRNWASGARELLGLLFTLRQWKESGQMRKTNMYWITDSENMVTFIQKGSRKAHIQALAFEVAQLTSELEIRIEPVHLLRQDPRIEIADEGSKRQDTDNWSLDVWSFNMIQEKIQHQFDTDLFADCNNRRTDRFFSLYYSEGTSGVDAFAQDWAALGNLWICPPVSRLIDVHRRIKETKSKGVVVFPAWESSSFLPFFMENLEKTTERYQLVCKWRPYIIQNENARNTALFGNTQFEFLALRFDNRLN